MTELAIYFFSAEGAKYQRALHVPSSKILFAQSIKAQLLANFAIFFAPFAFHSSVFRLLPTAFCLLPSGHFSGTHA